MDTVKKSFVLYLDYKANLDMLTNEQKGMLLNMIFEYASSGSVLEADPVVKMAFSFIKNNLDRDMEKYEKTCERNRNNGKLGGRPKKQVDNSTNPNNPSGLLNNPTEPIKPDTDTDNDTDNDTDTDTDNDTDTNQLTNKDVGELAKHYSDCFRKMIPPIHLDKLKSYLDDGLELELIKYIMEYSSDKKEPWKYCSKVLENSVRDMITTVDEFKSSLKTKEGDETNGSNAKEFNYAEVRANWGRL